MRLLIPLAFLLMAPLLHGQDAKANLAGWPFKITIKTKLIVSSPEDSAALIVKGYMLRELKKIPDVELTDLTPDYVISVCVVPATLRDGNSIGYVISYVICSTVNEKMAKNEVAVLRAYNIIDSKEEDRITWWLNTDGVLADQFVQQSDGSNLAKTCCQSIIKIDSDDFVPFRNLMKMK